jgi:hypothetical protein
VPSLKEVLIMSYLEASLLLSFHVSINCPYITETSKSIHSAYLDKRAAVNSNKLSKLRVANPSG